ncbi:cardiolipin synthase [Rhodopirellula sp. MGV]|uniref:cardiolipin synthase n=1 Tax=Rhodopirellula sp. MGV TaxID=2023130 RepID=UPI000B962890|nr:cardiolipin synthase [Rhodopirellula sp. MGV]OYP28427.1 cardiolipin synthase [Rhodopirellula sp. MGV]PNY38696.1 cardiolipin synthase [Rhodopirellula baltica]
MNLIDYLGSLSWTTLTSLLVIGIEIIAIASALHAIWFVRTTQAAIAWVVALVSLPMVSIPLYWVFGRYRFQGYRESIREVGQRHKRSVAAINTELKTAVGVRSTELRTPLDAVADVLDTPICDDNQASLLINGEAFYTSVIEQIKKARRYVYLEFYIIRDDEIGRQLAAALIERVQRGVTVRLLYDNIGSIGLSRHYVQRLVDAGIDVHAFDTPTKLTTRFQVNFRNHRKLIVIDGHTSLVGGFNVGKEYTGNAGWTDHWRDTAVLLTGPITRKVQAVFAGDYYWAARQDLPEAHWKPMEPPAHVSQDGQAGDCRATGCRAAMCATGPADDHPRATMMFSTVAASARERLWVTTPYLVPDDTTLVSLLMARARGVDVRILIPSIADHYSVFFAGFYYERELMDAGIRVGRYREGLMHQKCWLVDDKLAMVGSTNLDHRSLHLNFEMMVAIECPNFIATMEQMLQSDFQEARWPDPAAKADHPWLTGIGRVVARLFSPIL